jgi:hypothetical protein
MRYLRQQELYYTTIIKLINLRNNNEVSKFPSFPESFPEINTENFMSNAMALPHSTENSEVSEEEFLKIVAQLDNY